MTQTLESMYRQLRDKLAPITASSLQAEAESRLILEEVMGVTFEQIVSEGTLTVPENMENQIGHLLYARTEKRIPLQYLLHAAWFYGLKLYVNPHVLIPRPETELLVEEVLRLLPPGGNLVDVGTGSGAIGLALSHALKDAAEVHATDISPEALMVARLNQRKLGTSVIFHQGDLLTPVKDRTFDLIVSNPPYVPPEDRETLAVEVHGHEPGLALFAPAGDPLYFYRRLAMEGLPLLKPGGTLLMELGPGQSETIEALLAECGYEGIRLINDYTARPRIASGRKP